MMKGYCYKYDRTRPLVFTADDVDVTDCAWALRVQTELDNIFFPASEDSCASQSAQEIDWIVRLLELIVGDEDSDRLLNEALPDENIVPLVLPGDNPISPDSSTESTEYVGDERLS